jgi:YbgC/YbaW family acyl-CoA thioester hydrolase
MAVYLHTGQRVRFQDVDHAGIVFFAKFFEYCHVVYEDFVEEVLGLGPTEFFEVRKYGAPLVATRSEHLAPLRHGDRMTVEMVVTALGRSSFTMEYTIRNESQVVCARVWLTHAFITTADGFESIPIPTEIGERLIPYLADA